MLISVFFQKSIIVLKKINFFRLSNLGVGISICRRLLCNLPHATQYASCYSGLQLPFCSCLAVWVNNTMQYPLPQLSREHRRVSRADGLDTSAVGLSNLYSYCLLTVHSWTSAPVSDGKGQRSCGTKSPTWKLPNKLSSVMQEIAYLAQLNIILLSESWTAWWGDNAHLYTQAACVTRRFLSLPATSEVWTERAADESGICRRLLQCHGGWGVEGEASPVGRQTCTASQRLVASFGWTVRSQVSYFENWTQDKRKRERTFNLIIKYSIIV